MSNGNGKVETAVYGKKVKKGVTPAIGLVDPKYAHNVGEAVRVASCWGAKQVWYSGNRVSMQGNGKKYRIPREERMRGYQSVELRQFDYFLDQFDDVTPIAVELRQSSVQLPEFKHPKNPLYLFGPEDGSLPKQYLKHCHQFLVVPARHCLNLSGTIYTILYDRFLKKRQSGEEPWRPMSEILQEKRAWTEERVEGLVE